MFAVSDCSCTANN